MQQNSIKRIIVGSKSKDRESLQSGPRFIDTVNTKKLNKFKMSSTTYNKFFSESNNKGSTSTEYNPNQTVPRRFSHSNVYKTVDVDVLKDQILKLKIENNRITKEMSFLKIENCKLEEDNRKNLRVMEEILHAAGKSSDSIIQAILKAEEGQGELQDPQNQDNDEFCISPNNFIRLREIFVISSLKKQITQMRQIIQQKDEELDNIKLNSKVMKYAKLEYSYNNNLTELNQFKKENENLKINLEDTISKFKELFDEKENYRTSLGKIKSQLEEIKTKNKSLDEDNKSLSDNKRVYEEKISHLSKVIETYNRVKNKEKITAEETAIKKENSNLNNLQANLDNLKNEKLRLEKKNSDLMKEIRQLREVVDRIEIKEKSEIDLKNTKNDELQNLRNQIKKLENKINSLEQEIIDIKKERDFIFSKNKEITDSLINLRLEKEKLSEERDNLIKSKQESNNSNINELLKEKDNLITNLESECNDMKINHESMKIEIVLLKSKKIYNRF
jgi:chromosome segregation ATPase